MLWIPGNILGVLVACIAVLLYVLYKRKIGFFSRSSMPYIKPTYKDIFYSFSFDYLIDLPFHLYRKYSKNDGLQYIGYFQSIFTPGILVLDPSFTGNILIKNFSHFHDHGFEMSVDRDPLAGHLFNMKGDKWRALRHKLLPTFTSGKLKGMVPMINDCADNLIYEMKQNEKFRKEACLKEVIREFTLAVIASCAFGIDPVSIKDPECEFRRVAKRCVNPPKFRQLLLSISIIFPKLANLLKVKLIPQDIDEFFLHFLKETFKMRKASAIKRNDFMQLLLELKEKGSVDFDVKDLEDDEKNIVNSLQATTHSATLDITDELLMAQVFVFFIAGFDNSSYLISLTAYLLSKNPDVQKRVREEVKQMKEKYGELNYQAYKEMKLLGGCVDEALRLHPPLKHVFRVCTKSITFEDGHKIEKGTPVIIPALGFQMDPKYWSDPEKFKPDRFINGEQIHTGTYLPFGDGPRICIAQRLALLQTKIMLAKLLENFEIRHSSKTKEPLKIRTVFGIDVVGGLWANFHPI